MTTTDGLLDTLDEAQKALRTAEADVRADMGEDVVEDGWSDIVRAVAFLCTEEIAAELYRTQGVDPR